MLSDAAASCHRPGGRAARLRVILATRRVRDAGRGGPCPVWPHDRRTSSSPAHRGQISGISS